MTKKDYQKPTMKVVPVRMQSPLLAGSGLNDPTDYPGGGDPFNF